ncbi:MAG: GTPase ObgE, partial [Nevskiales bacterium]
LLPADGSDVLDNIRQIPVELEKFSEELSARERWLVFNKSDLLLPEEARARADELVRQLGWQRPVYLISALQRNDLDQLMQDVMAHIETLGRPAQSERQDGEDTAT